MTGRHSAFPVTSAEFWKQSLTFSNKALVCGVLYGPAWDLRTIRDQEAMGVG